MDLCLKCGARAIGDTQLCVAHRVEVEPTEWAGGFNEGQCYEYQRWLSAFSLLGFKMHPGLSPEENLRAFAEWYHWEVKGCGR